MKHLIIGYGEVGQGLHKVVGGAIHDPFKHFIALNTFDVMHVCIPWNDKFIKAVRKYQKEFKPSLTIIHSSVPVGTSKKLNAVHSPIRGVHPNIDLGIKTFVKYFGGKNAVKAANIFNKLGVKTKVVKDSNTTEAAKLWDTTQYGVFILLNKEIKRWCEKNKVDFDIVYTDFNKTYNEGYLDLDRPEVVRPRLKYMEGKIGGHCVIPNAKLLTSHFAKLLTDENK